MNQIRVSAAAKSDLEEIWLYIGRDNPEIADTFVSSILSRFAKLVAWPQIGRHRKELSAGLRSSSIGRYVVFYRQISDGIEIVRVLHGARDLPPLLE